FDRDRAEAALADRLQRRCGPDLRGEPGAGLSHFHTVAYRQTIRCRMEAAMRNIQHRDIEAPAAAVGALLDRLASDTDPLWPAPAWPPIRLDRGLVVGSVGGHGPIRYSVAEYQPGRRVRFAFDPSIGFDGFHELLVEPLDERRTRLTHDLVGKPSGAMRLVWPLAVRWMHEALLQDLLDNAELAATGRLREKARWSRWVRFLRARMSPQPEGVPLPQPAALATTEL